MRASELAAALRDAVVSGPDVPFGALRADSKRVAPGDAFIALEGSTTDGHLFIGDAVSRGASLVVCNAGRAEDLGGATFVTVPDTKVALKTILGLLHPRAKGVRMIGVTGTNGKTTTTYLVESILKVEGIPCGLIGTIEVRHPQGRLSSTLTTPGPVDLYELLDGMAASGAQACVMEVSSHALDQDRVLGIAFECAVFTNLSQDHLDYHHDMESYFSAKRRLFTEHLEGTAVVNGDDPYGRRLASEIPQAVEFGFDEHAPIHPVSMENTPEGLSLELATPRGEIALKSRLRGAMNAANIMAAVGACQAMGCTNEGISAGIAALTGVPGRMEPVPNRRGLTILVDYAHTPDALDTVLKDAKAFTKGRLIVVFGCGGDRDRTKRPVMGSIAAGRADLVFVTSDNPRTEDPEAIIGEILAGIPGGSNVHVEPDRAMAIARAVSEMRADDCLVIAGKGHEDYQIVGTTKIPFDDRACVRSFLGEEDR
ncbi:MAG TPA: UDP-N-acetylmuramoyl-L-alanyl-D-glutamate--2,6-diaminopimelate ligase [Deltaproteobacteria bacterium]|nr:UDP-N-acetylmuramoyl-L-alanyl-D-glutamate--2,6-diaminopimelate ligase [Deltaproteobacteria bacterium]HOM28906.1 UDP-N-acetylmuramoyl-L-alanyl-D-glutamate--2,6-diaminopimelate ligase [Deltaproteobacteria bacterium]HPP80163.1 UDP-N-acetylmuramoyl-L-alanyl-D-glutamate--2,6-diaminopimelate ligase [Deltaproteobacteria bacterium]